MRKSIPNVLILGCICVGGNAALAYDIPLHATANGNYSELLQVVHCPQDQGQYGNYHDYGYYDASAWCGVQTVAGFWVWVSPNWYIWKNSQSHGSVTEYNSRQGSGSYDSEGNWNHYTKPTGGSSGMGVGGTSDGCIYTTTGWSNC